MDNKRREAELQNIEFGKLKITGTRIDNKWSFTAKKHGKHPITLKDILDCKNATKVENLTNDLKDKLLPLSLRNLLE